MKHFTTLLLTTILSCSVSAQVVSNGFYRVKNYKTNRTLYVMSDYSRGADIAAGTADFGSIVPWSNAARNPSCDPQCIIYFKYMTDKGGYDLHSQGAETFKMVKEPIKIGNYGKNTGRYVCYATKSGTSLYLSDVETEIDEDEGTLDTKDLGKEYYQWYITPVTANSENYFGIAPTLTVENKHYAPFYAAFSFKVYSAGMKVYTVEKYMEQDGKGYSVLHDITNFPIPAKTPVLIECPSMNPSDNRIELLAGEYYLGSKENKLMGNMFCYGLYFNETDLHRKFLKFNAEEMRGFGITKEGKLGLVKNPVGLVSYKDSKYLDHNTSYLPGIDLPEEITFISDKEYEEKVSVDKIADDKKGNTSIHDLSGKPANNTKRKGIYIVGDKKVLVK